MPKLGTLFKGHLDNLIIVYTLMVKKVSDRWKGHCICDHMSLVEIPAFCLVAEFLGTTDFLWLRLGIGILRADLLICCENQMR